VLGEQSAKSLRGGRMEDVIFVGSQRRKALGMAEVSLELEVDPSFHHAENGKLVIGRRVFPTGESRYRINGRTVRLKEIKDLLMDTGLGIRAYSVIEQGKVGMILSGKPQERRRLLEEAAGVTRYKARRRIAEVKLEEARGNLLRLDDIVSEVERALRSLKRQAAAARRYREREAEHRALLSRVLAGRWARLSAELSELAGALAAAEEREAALTAELSTAEASLAEERETLEALARTVAERHQRVAEAAATIEGRQQFLAVNRKRLAETHERAAQSHRQAERREGEIAAAGEALAGHRERRDEMAAELERATAEVSRDEEALKAAGDRLRAADARVEEQRRGLLEAADAINRLRARRQQAQIELERGTFQRRRLGEEAEQHGGELRQAVEALETAGARVEELGGRIGRERAELATVEADLERTLAAEAAAGERRRAAEADLAEARNYQKLLTELSRAHLERRSRLESALAEAGLAGPALAGPALDGPVFLADRARALDGWERALDFFLADLADAVVAREAGSALALAATLGGGPGGAVIAPAAAAAEALPEVDDPAVVLTLGEALGLPAELAAALPPAFLVEQPADAARLARAFPGIAFVSRGGVWAAGGVLRVAPGEAAPGVLERSRELAELEQEVPARERAVAAASAEIETLVARRSELARDANRRESGLAQIRQELAVAEARREDAEARRRRLAAELAELETERDRVAGELAAAEERRVGVDGEVAAAEEAHTGAQERFDRLEREREGAKADREALREASAGRRGRLDLLAERLAAHDREIARIESESGDGRRQVELWRGEAERLERIAAELTGELERAEIDLQAALEDRAGGQEAVLAAQAELDVQRAALRRREEEIAALRDRRDAARAEEGDLRVRRAGRRQDAEHLAAQHREAFDEELATEPGAPPPNLAELEADLARTRLTLERLGPVNVLAVEEYAEQEERHTFLTTQRADVIESVERLRATIQEIDATSSERFAATFEVVNKAFGVVFQQLFRGGEAEMRLLDDDDPLDSGIEIVARPPGKRAQNIMLLSGGEKALTAIALLFALFQTKPSPFCILDEVDAPLDDVNTLRFVELLTTMAGDTQFIVITHNKLSMEAAGTLYGVTMEEKGVSKLVAVEIDRVQPLEAAAASA
jgi:chromosome segregation protein